MALTSFEFVGRTRRIIVSPQGNITQGIILHSIIYAPPQQFVTGERYFNFLGSKVLQAFNIDLRNDDRKKL